MTFRALLTYHPNVGTFRNGRGAWRVGVCYSVLDDTSIKVGVYYPGNQHHTPVKALRMPVARRLQRGTWVNPTKLLHELLAQRRADYWSARPKHITRIYPNLTNERKVA